MANVNGSIASAPIATFGGTITGVANEGRMGASLAGVALLVGALSTWAIGTVSAAPIATFGGSATGTTFTGEMAATLTGTSTAVGNLGDYYDSFLTAVVPSAPIATFGGSAVSVLFDGRMGAAPAGVGSLTGTLAVPILGTVPSGPIATFGGSAAGIVTDGALGNIQPAAIATFGGSATAYVFDPRVFGSGAGRTHLFLGQVDTAAVPASHAGDLYVLTSGYGNPEGAATDLLIETPDIAPLGELGRLRVRLASFTVQYEAACTVQVTPIVDYDTELPAVSVALPPPRQVERTVIPIRMMRALTVIRFRIQVTGGEGLVELYTPILYYAPLASRSGMAMGERP